jgi:hypothetical protein
MIHIILRGRGGGLGHSQVTALGIKQEFLKTTPERCTWYTYIVCL